MDISFSIYVPINLGADTTYDIFYHISNQLANNKDNLSFYSIFCDKIQYLKSINSFLLIATTRLSFIPKI